MVLTYKAEVAIISVAATVLSAVATYLATGSPTEAGFVGVVVSALAQGISKVESPPAPT